MDFQLKGLVELGREKTSTHQVVQKVKNYGPSIRFPFAQAASFPLAWKESRL